MCHNEGYDAYPHAEDGKDMTSVCADCHWRKTRVIEAEYEQSVHAKHLIDRITCLTCHDPHTVRTARQVVEPRKIVAQDNRVCLGCHDSDFTFAQYAPEQKSRPDIDEVHQWLPNARRHWKAVRCIECHTRTEREMVSHKILDKSQANKKCVLCHSANSELLHTLYRHLAQEEQRKYGFLNSVILGNSYVISATRHPTLDSIILALIKLTVAGVLLHGLLRYVAARIRRKKHHE
jgi:predicted CXXCH cytochrome family protein